MELEEDDYDDELLEEEREQAVDHMDADNYNFQDIDEEMKMIDHMDANINEYIERKALPPGTKKNHGRNKGVSKTVDPLN